MRALFFFIFVHIPIVAFFVLLDIDDEDIKTHIVEIQEKVEQLGSGGEEGVTKPISATNKTQLIFLLRVLPVLQGLNWWSCTLCSF